MFDWYWALEGWQWIVATILVLSSGAAVWFGIVVLIAKTIAQGAEHNINTCMCNPCQIRRAKAWNRRTDGGKRLYRRNPPGALVSTLDLHPGDIVSSRKGPRYHVDEIVSRDFAMVVKLTNMCTEQKSWVTISHARVHTKLWLIDGNPPERLIGL